MTKPIDRRDFLKTASVAAGALAYRSDEGQTAGRQATGPASTKIGGVAYAPVADYPIRPTSHAEVIVDDTFWKPKIATNARVTIPFEVQKLTENGRALSGNVLEAAILSLQTHPDPALQAAVEASVRRTARRTRWRQQRIRGGRHVLQRHRQARSARSCGHSRPTRSTRTSSTATRRSPAASATRSTACSSTA